MTLIGADWACGIGAATNARLHRMAHINFIIRR
jgi:hypothetical protein